MAIYRMVNGQGKVSGLIVVEEAEQLISELVAVVDRRAQAPLTQLLAPTTATLPPGPPANENDGGTRKGRARKVKGARANGNGPVAKARAIFEKMVPTGATRKEILKACKKAHIKQGTAATQYQMWKHAHPSTAAH